MKTCAGLIAGLALAVIESAAADDLSYAAWKRHISAYKPDYSDSSRCLLPREGNRFAQPFDVVKNGKAVCNIVIAIEQKNDLVLRKTAEELQKYVKLLTGVELKIEAGWMGHKDNRFVANHICLGKRLIPSYRESGWFANDGWNEALAKIGFTDGYAIRFNVLEKDKKPNNNLHVFGTLEKGVMNGVFALLENNTDLIWARPNEAIGTVYTEVKDLSFVWGEGVVSVPDTPSRGWNSYFGLEWMAHNGCNLYNGGGGGDISFSNPKKNAWGVYYTRHLGGHNIQHFFHGVTDKRCFPRGADDERLSDNFWYGNPCFTSPVCLENFVSNLLNCARMAPEGTRKIYVNTQDTWNECRCPKCLSPIVLPDGRTVKVEDDNFRSTQYWMFMNAAGRRLAKELPGMGIVSLAYFFTAPPPAVRLEPNVWPEFAPYVRSNDKAPINAPENLVWFDRLKGWYANCTKEIEIYDYYGLGLDFPRPLAEVKAWDFRLMDPYVLGMTSEENSFRDEVGKPAERMWDVSAMEHWVITRLYWDPTADVERLRKYYIRRAFRDAAPEVEKVYGIIREEWYRNSRASTLGDNPLDLTKLLLVQTGRAKEIRALLDAAAAKPNHPKSAELAKRLRAQLLVFITEAENLKNPMAQLPLVRVEKDPDFDDAVWNRAADLGGFVKVSKADRTQVPESKTEIRMFHDSDNIHMRLRCFDAAMKDRKRIVPPSGKKEFIPGCDHVEIYFSDPLADGAYYLFTVSPDDLTSELKGYDDQWNGVWRHRLRETPTGYDIVFSLPLKTINANNAKGNDLKFLVLREIWAHGSVKRENTSWGGGGWHQFATFGDLKLLR